MKKDSCCERVFGPAFFALVFGILLAFRPSVAAGEAVPAQAPVTPASSDLFQSTNIISISVEIPEEGLQSLRRSTPARSTGTKPRALATVSEGGRIYSKVTVQLKGFTSFRPVDSSPGLTLSFDKLLPQQKFHGLSKISLNNSSQDSTRLHEKFARELFAAAGVPVPRADYAWVTLNGRDLGLYVLLEGYDKDFLKQHFERADGVLWEGGVLQDIDRPVRVSVGKDDASDAPVRELLRASRIADAGERWRALEASVDMDRFFSMVAVETILCHSDSYSMNRNNYRLYYDPGCGKIVFMPHGMDRILGAHRSGLDLPILPPTLGLAARAALSTPEGRRRYVERAGMLFTNLFQPKTLCQRARNLESRIIHSKSGFLTFGDIENRWERGAENLCGRIARRAEQLAMQFAHLDEVIAPVPTPVFDDEGIARIEGWMPKRTLSSPEIFSEREIKSERQVMHLRAPEGPLKTSLRAKISLPAGRYRLSGSIRAFDAADAPTPVQAFILRYSGDRFGLEQRRLGGKTVDYSFKVSESRAPEEIELACDIREEDASEVWFDGDSLRLIREKP